MSRRPRPELHFQSGMNTVFLMFRARQDIDSNSRHSVANAGMTMTTSFTAAAASSAKARTSSRWR
eukprot:1714814-Pyramimonas_sp.AAC.1